MIKIGIGKVIMIRVLVAWILGFAASFAFAAQVEFKAQADREEISQDESVSVSLSVEIDGSGGSSMKPSLKAPDFEQLSTYNSQAIQSYFENGKVGMKNTQTLTYVLRPKKTGKLVISGISVSIDDQSYTAPNITVQVNPGGAGNSPPRGYGGNVGLRGTGKTGDRRAFFIRSEVNKNKVFKGEQVIVSYYLYERSRVFNIQPTQYPVLNGFLREDLELPIQNQRLEPERVMLDGVSYRRALLARYAAYPLQEGALKIDSMTIQANVQDVSGAANLGDEEDDPFFQLFRNMAPSFQQSVQKSEPVAIEVLPLPVDGRPADFSGGVGEFDVNAAVNKTELKAGDSVMLTVVVQGRGNVSNIQEPKAAWPKGLDLYESKGRSKTSPGGIGEKVFELLLIPRASGEVTIPPVSFSFFNPAKKTYEKKSSDPIVLRVQPGDPNSSAPSNPVSQANPNASPQEDWMSLKIAAIQHLFSTALAWIILIGLMLLGTIIFWVKKRGSKKDTVREKHTLTDIEWEDLTARSKKAVNQGSPQLIHSLYLELEQAVLIAIEEKYHFPARARSRLEIRDELVSKNHLTLEKWNEIVEVLEYSELVRFSGGTYSAERLVDMTEKARKWVLGLN